LYGSENVFTTNDLVFQPLKLSALKEKKALYFPTYMGEDVLSKVKPAEDAETTIEYVDSIISGKKFDLINMNNKVELDLFVLGSVLVSKDGRRIGTVDIIVTPSEVITVENPPQRPTGILWDHISERQLQNSAVLQSLKL
uniref:Uncharacterized protein n=1 Tax=Megaselia scalaris TaxID=36166 RepID=T1GXJ4_MEGSC